MWTFIKGNSLKSFQYNFIHILRMVRQNLTYLNKLSVSLLLLIFVYVIYNNKMEISVNTYWIWSKSLGIQNRNRQVLQSFDLSLNIEEECENNSIYEIEEYLRNRRFCILKYCGDVCNTQIETTRSKVFIAKLYLNI